MDEYVARRGLWVVMVLVLVGLLWLLAPVLTPFVVSALLAWLGDPMVARLERAGRSRTTAVLIVFGLMTLIVVLSLLVIVPLLQDQVLKLIAWLPQLSQWAQTTAIPWLENRTGLKLAGYIDPSYLLGLVQEHWPPARGVATAGSNRQRVGLPRFKHRADFFQRSHPAFDPTGIDQEGQPRHRRIPEFLVEFQEREVDRHTRGIADMNLLVGVAPAHRSRELHVELQLSLRQFFRGRIHLHHRGARRRRVGGQFEVRDHRRRAGRGILRPIPDTARKRKPRFNPQAIPGNLPLPGHWRPAARCGAGNGGSR